MKINLPNYLKASTPELLRELMLNKIMETGLDIKFFNIQFDGKNWISWHYESIDFDFLLARIKSMKSKDK